MKKFLTCIKDGIIGFLFGLASLIPGVAGGTVLLVSGAYKKVVGAVSNLFSKAFIKNLLILIPFAIGIILSIATAAYPITLALQYCMIGIVCLFAGLIIGIFPSLIAKVKGSPWKNVYIVPLVFSFIIAGILGVFSIIFKTNSFIEQLFVDRPYYIYFIVFGVGFVCSSGLILPGFSGSMLLLALCFYKPILTLFQFNNFLSDFSVLAAFIVGVFIGFIFFSKLMNHFLKAHQTGTYYSAIGLVAGSLISIFVNASVFDYIKGGSVKLIDKILGPILLVVGVVIGILFYIYLKKHPETKENA